MKMKVNTYKVMAECVERGIDAGWRRAHKHDDKPGENLIKEQIAQYIELEMSEYFEWEVD